MPLEEGKHAAESGKSGSEYAKQVGQSQPAVALKIMSARVWSAITRVITPQQAKDSWRNLAEIHAAPQWLAAGLELFGPEYEVAIEIVPYRGELSLHRALQFENSIGRNKVAHNNEVIHQFMHWWDDEIFERFPTWYDCINNVDQAQYLLSLDDLEKFFGKQNENGPGHYTQCVKFGVGETTLTKMLDGAVPLLQVREGLVQLEPTERRKRGLAQKAAEERAAAEKERAEAARIKAEQEAAQRQSEREERERQAELARIAAASQAARFKPAEIPPADFQAGALNPRFQRRCDSGLPRIAPRPLRALCAILRSLRGILDSDPTAYVLSANVHRRHLTKGQQAMAVALAYPDASKLKRAGSGSFLKKDQDAPSEGYISKARFVLRHCRDKAEDVLKNAKYPLTVAYEEAQARIAVLRWR